MITSAAIAFLGAREDEAGPARPSLAAGGLPCHPGTFGGHAAHGSQPRHDAAGLSRLQMSGSLTVTVALVHPRNSAIKLVTT